MICRLCNIVYQVGTTVENGVRQRGQPWAARCWQSRVRHRESSEPLFILYFHRKQWLYCTTYLLVCLLVQKTKYRTVLSRVDVGSGATLRRFAVVLCNALAERGAGEAGRLGYRAPERGLSRLSHQSGGARTGGQDASESTTRRITHVWGVGGLLSVVRRSFPGTSTEYLAREVQNTRKQRPGRSP